MRLFLNAVSNLKKQSFSDICPKVLQIMEENNWKNEHTLFHFHDINDAKAETQTPHAKLCKAFPEFAPYWKSDYEEYIKTHLSPPIDPHQVSFFTNFPGMCQGKTVFLPDDPMIDNQKVMQVMEKVPRPYSFYSSIVMLDKINWHREKSGEPMWDWRCMREGFLPGAIRYSVEDAYYYQSNCVLLWKRFDMKPEMILRIELTEENGKDKADRIVETFAGAFGSPEKKFVYAVPGIEEKEQYVDRLNKMRTVYAEWKQGIKTELMQFEKAAVEQIIKNVEAGAYGKKRIPSRKVMQQRFLKNNDLARHDVCRWDDHGWCRRLPHNIWLHIMFWESEKALFMTLSCYGILFELHQNIFVTEFEDEHGDVAGALAFEKFQYVLKSFIDQVVPKLLDIYRDDTENFYQESYEQRYFTNDYLFDTVENL